MKPGSLWFDHAVGAKTLTPVSYCTNSRLTETCTKEWRAMLPSQDKH